MTINNDGAASARCARRPAKLLAGSLALSIGALGAGLAVTAAPAYADVVSGNYTIGGPPWNPSAPVSAVTATPATLNTGTPDSFVVSFTVPTALSGAHANWLSIASSVALGSVPNSIVTSTPGCLQSGTAGVGGAGSSAATGLTIELASTCNISAGSRVQVDFTANAPSAAGSFYFSVTTALNTTAALSNSVVVGPSGPSLSAASHAFGANTTYTISNVPVLNLSANQAAQDTVVLSAGVTRGTEALTFYDGAASGYTVVYTPPGGAAISDPVQSANAQGAQVTLTLANPIMTGGSLNLTALGTNPPAASSPSPTTSSWARGTAPHKPPTRSSSARRSATQPFRHRAWRRARRRRIRSASRLGAASVRGTTSRSVKAAAPPTLARSASVGVSDVTQGWHYAAVASSLSSGSAMLPVSDPVSAGDALIVTLANVTNPPAGTISDFAVSTSSDAVPTDAPPYTVGAIARPAASPASGVVVTPVPNSAGSLATYTVANLHASSSMTGGASTIRLLGPAGTVFPSFPNDYAVLDSSRASGSGAVTAPVAGGGTNSVTVTVPNTISSGDLLELTVQGVVNPVIPSSTYSIDVVGNVTGATVLPSFPKATLSYPNGAIVSFAGNDYVFAGGRAFAIANSSELSRLQKVDHAAVLSAPASSTAPANRAPRPGTLLFTRPVNGGATIYVAGTDGELHGFATPKQFAADGYDPALVVTVTSLGGLVVGRSAGSQGAAGNALGTSADGAIVDSSGAYFVFAGGRAFAIPNAAALAAVRKADKAKEVNGIVTTAQKSAGIASGIVLSALGPVYVSYQGSLYGFMSLAQLGSDGYAGTAAVPAPSTNGLNIQPYSGS